MRAFILYPFPANNGEHFVMMTYAPVSFSSLWAFAEAQLLLISLYILSAFQYIFFKLVCKYK